MMNKRRILTLAAALVLILAVVALTYQTASANEPRQRGERKKEVKMFYGNSYDISIGRSGVYFANTYYDNVTAVIEKTDADNRGWRYFTQGIMSVHVYDEDGVAPDRFLGAVQVYFNLDLQQRKKYDDPDSNMSIWYKDEWGVGQWVKCPTFLVKSKAAPRGRAVCYASDFGDYGLAWTWPTLRMKLEKAALENLDDPADCSCNGNYYNCDDFDSQTDAQSCYDACIADGKGDIHDLDSDSDGTACEE